MSNIPNKWNEIFGTQSQGKTDWINSYSNYICGSISSTMSTQDTFGILPIAMRVSSKTIGFDLVSVQPMLAPSMSLFYSSYDTINTRRIRKIKKLINRIEGWNLNI